MCNVNYAYDELVDNFNNYGEGVELELEEVWYVVNEEGDVLSQSDCRDGAVEYIQRAVEEDLFYHGYAQKYKIEQGEF